MPLTIDINCDVGEGVGNEQKLLPLISSCNIACGGHAGNIESISNCLLLAKKHKVKVGAHPSYPDIKNFGRVSMPIQDEYLIESINSQMETFLKECLNNKISMHHIKPHGALYNDVAKNEAKALTFLKAIQRFKEIAYVYVPYGSMIEKLAIFQKFKIKREAFADRNYNNDLSLVSRKFKNAVIHDRTKVLNHILPMITKNYVNTIAEEKIPIIADTYCIHGDTPTAYQILTYLSIELYKNQILIEK